MGKAPQPDRPSGEGQGAGNDLLVRFQDGDPAAFQAIVGEYQGRLVQFFYRLCWDRDRAEDFAQELFMKLVRSAHRYQPQGKLSTFIFRVATNLWIDHYRVLRPRPRLYSLDQPVHGMNKANPASLPDDIAGPVERAIDSEEKRRLRQGLESLTEPHRLVFELAVYQQLAYADIAQVLNIPVGTVKSRMHNAVKALREILKVTPSDSADVQRHRGYRQGGGSA